MNFRVDVVGMGAAPIAAGVPLCVVAARIVRMRMPEDYMSRASVVRESFAGAVRSVMPVADGKEMDDDESEKRDQTDDATRGGHGAGI